MENTIKVLKIIYYPLGNKRYMRSLEIEDNKNIFVNSPFNLGFLKVKNKDELNKDFEITKRFIKLNGVRV
jgi:hypothetical protein